MSINWRRTVGTATIIGVLGLTAYSIYLHRRQKKESNNDISIDEAKEITERFRKTLEDDIREKEKFDEALERVSKVAISVKTPEEVENDIREEEERQIKEDLAEEVLEPEPVLLEDEGDGKLRYDPNSDEAYEQFKRMELAEWAPHEELYRTLDFMYGLYFEPTVDGDVILHNKLSDHRAEFFGPASKWVERVSFSDIVLHYARLLDFNLGDGVRYWTRYILETNNLNIYERDEDDIEHMVALMDLHTFLIKTPFKFGIFALREEQYENVKKVADEHIDRCITYDLEFNEFLNGMM